MFPSQLTLRPGQSRTAIGVRADAVARRATRPARSCVTASGSRAATSIPVTLRSQIDVRHGGAFSGVLTGGNGRAPTARARRTTTSSTCPRGVKDVTANVSLANDAADPVGAYLVSPDGDILGYGQNQDPLDRRHTSTRR